LIDDDINSVRVSVTL